MKPRVGFAEAAQRLFWIYEKLKGSDLGRDRKIKKNFFWCIGNGWWAAASGWKMKKSFFLVYRKMKK